MAGGRNGRDAPSPESAGYWLGRLVQAQQTGDPLAVVAVVAQYEHRVERMLHEAVQAARATGCTWEQIGAAAGTSRQAAWARFRIDERRPGPGQL